MIANAQNALSSLRQTPTNVLRKKKQKNHTPILSSIDKKNVNQDMMSKNITSFCLVFFLFHSLSIKKCKNICLRGMDGEWDGEKGDDNTRLMYHANTHNTTHNFNTNCNFHFFHIIFFLITDFLPEKHHPFLFFSFFLNGISIKREITLQNKKKLQLT